MNWNGPMTVKQFVLLFWVPVFVLAAAGGFYLRSSEANAEAQQIDMAAAPAPAMHHHPAMGNAPASPPAVPADPDKIRRDREELHRNIEATKAAVDRARAEAAKDADNGMQH